MFKNVLFYYFSDKLVVEQRQKLFTILDRYYSAAEAIAFPLPNGFSSFFVYLGFRTQPFAEFKHYVSRNVYEMPMDALHAIFKTLGDSPEATVQKHFVLEKVPRIRSMRLLRRMEDSTSLRILGRFHANDVLSGANSSPIRPRTRSAAIGKINGFDVKRKLCMVHGTLLAFSLSYFFYCSLSFLFFLFFFIIYFLHFATNCLSFPMK